MGHPWLQFLEGQSRESLGLTGYETFTIEGLSNDLKPRQKVTVKAKTPDGKEKAFEMLARLDTPIEVEYYRHGGILQMVLREMMK